MRNTYKFDGIIFFVAFIFFVLFVWGLSQYMLLRSDPPQLHVESQLPRQITVDDFIEVTIIDTPTDNDGKWTLVETSDRQRCYFRYYRGEPGDSFVMLKERLQEYYPCEPCETKNPNLIDLSKEMITQEN